MNNSKTQQKIPLILASNGKTGSRVAERFRASGLGFREGSEAAKYPLTGMMQAPGKKRSMVSVPSTSCSTRTWPFPVRKR